MDQGDEASPGFEAGSGMTTLFEGEWATVRRMRKGKLVVVAGADQGKELEISKPRVTGGRSIISDLVVADKAVSGTHFEVAARDDDEKAPCAHERRVLRPTFDGTLAPIWSTATTRSPGSRARA